MAGCRSCSGRRSGRSCCSAAAAGREAACAAVARFAERFALPVATTFRRAHLFDPLHPCYAGDLGIGPNPKLLARIKGADLVLLVGGRLGEMPSQGYTLLDIPGPRQTFVHVHPGAEELGRVYRAASRDQCRADRVCRGARRPAAAERDLAGAARRRPRMPTTSPGPTSRPPCRAPSISARSWCGCATGFPPTRSSPTAPAISPSGCTATTATAASAPQLGADLRLDGLRRAGGGRHEAARAGAHRGRASPATAIS